MGCTQDSRVSPFPGKLGIPRAVPVGDGRLVAVLEPRDVLVQVGQAARHGLGDVAQLVPRHHVGLQEIRQGPLQQNSRTPSSVTLIQGKPAIPAELGGTPLGPLAVLPHGPTAVSE